MSTCQELFCNFVALPTHFYEKNQDSNSLPVIITIKLSK